MANDPTAAPGDLDAQAKKLYYRLRKHLREDFDTWHDADREALAQTCRWAQRGRLAREGMAQPGGKLLLMAEGVKGQDVEHPLAKTALAAERAFLEGLKELGFTPAARKRLGMEVKETSGKFGGALG